MLKLTWLDDLFSDGDGKPDTEGEPVPMQAEEWEPLDALPTAAEAQRTEDDARETPIEQALDDAEAGGKCRLSCFFWETRGAWWCGFCRRRQINVSHGRTWCPAAEALTGRCDLRK